MNGTKICFKITVKGNVLTYALDGVGKALHMLTDIYGQNEIALNTFSNENTDDYELAEVVWNNQHCIWKNVLEGLVAKSDMSEFYKEGLTELNSINFSDVDASVEHL